MRPGNPFDTACQQEAPAMSEHLARSVDDGGRSERIRDVLAVICRRGITRLRRR